MNEERLEREKNKRIKLNVPLNGTSQTEPTSQSTSHSSQIHHPTSSNSNSTNGNSSAAAAKKATTNGTTTTAATTEKQEAEKKEIAKLPHPKMSKLLSTSGKRIQKELAEITIDPPPNW